VVRGIGLAFLSPLSDLENCLLLVMMLRIPNSGNAAGALNILVLVPASGGGRRPSARGLKTRTSLFPYSTVAGARALVDSQDALSVFVATVVEDRAYNWGASRRRPRLSYGCSRYAYQLGYPLLISSTQR